MIGNLLGYFEKLHSHVTTALATFWETFGKNWANLTFLLQHLVTLMFTM